MAATRARPLVLVVLAACVGDIGGSEAPVTTPTRAVGPSVGSSPLRRLTRVEYDGTVRDLLGDETKPGQAGFPADPSAQGFDNNAEALGVDERLSEAYLEVAEEVAARAVAKDLAALLPCDPADGEDDCARQFVAGFGARAFRRPLDDGEIERLLEVYDVGRAVSFADGIRIVITATLLSPHFLYHVELDRADAVGRLAARVSPYELASRLSYFLWGSMPDGRLFDAAERGDLDDDESVEIQARRMLDDEKAHDAVANFHRQWLELGELGAVTKDEALFPEFTDELRADLAGELEAFAADAFWSDGKLGAFFVAHHSFVNARLATLYGIDPPSGPGLVKTPLDAERRSGILTLGAFLAATSGEEETSPILRGRFVRERLLCQDLSAPPNGLDIKPPMPDPTKPTRDRYEAHSKLEPCRTCHRMMDPIGFGFEHYDAIGRWRDKDGAFVVDASGEVLDGGDASGKFDGIIELSKRLAGSDDVRSCLVRQWFRYAHGRGESSDDDATLRALERTMSDTGGELRALLVAITTAPSFTHRKVNEP